LCLDVVVFDRGVQGLSIRSSVNALPPVLLFRQSPSSPHRLPLSQP
jgi:hypothetical protein